VAAPRSRPTSSACLSTVRESALRVIFARRHRSQGSLIILKGDGSCSGAVTEVRKERKRRDATHGTEVRYGLTVREGARGRSSAGAARVTLLRKRSTWWVTYVSQSSQLSASLGRQHTSVSLRHQTATSTIERRMLHAPTACGSGRAMRGSRTPPSDIGRTLRPRRSWTPRRRAGSRRGTLLIVGSCCVM